ncbi:uncharacterized protein V6R79_014362 [Siganus canaliculatus]
MRAGSYGPMWVFHPGFPPAATSAASIANANKANASAALHIPPPQYILVGDSIVRSVALQNGITYAFPGAKNMDLYDHIPATPLVLTRGTPLCSHCFAALRSEQYASETIIQTPQ